jgi:hypothetical protein
MPTEAVRAGKVDPVLDNARLARSAPKKKAP